MPAPRATLERLAELDLLWRAWARVRQNRGAPGGDGETVELFAAHAMARIARLQRELACGVYMPGPVRRVQVPKRSGGMRVLAIPCVVDRVAQTAAAMLLQPLLEPEFEEESYGYRPGRSVAMAVRRVAALYRAGYRWVVDGDIDDFFDEVEHRRLLEDLARHLDDPRLLDLVRLWLSSFSDDGRGLPQGSPLSPLLANLYLDRVDEEIRSEGVRLVRYADDFLLLCRSRRRAEAALARIAALLAERGLALDPEKTRIVDFERGFRFLGRLFVRSLVLEAQHEEPTATRARASLAEAAGTDAPPEEAVESEAPDSADQGDPVPAHGFGEPAITAAGPREAPAEGGALAEVVRPLYVFEPGRLLDVDGDAFVVVEDGTPLLRLPPGRVDRIAIGARARISEAALREAVAWRIPVALLDAFGRPAGLLAPALADRAQLHLAQAGLVLDEERRRELAREIVAARIHGQAALLARLGGSADDGLREARRNLKELERRARVAASVDEASGFEGAAGAIYWPALGSCLRHGFGLDLRRRRPPTDPVNAVISWLSSMLTRDVETLVLRRGLHPGFGVLHGARDRHDGCVYDLVEEFRAPLAEGTAIALFNRRRLRPEHFFLREEDGAVRLTAEGRTAVIRAWESRLDTSLRSPRSGRRTSWRGLMQEQVEAFARHALGEEPYRAFRLDY